MTNFPVSARTRQTIPGIFIAAVIALLAGVQATPAVAKSPIKAVLQGPVGTQPAAREHVVTQRRTRALDSDGDGLSNVTELRRTRTNPRKADTDGDGLSDWTEVKRTLTNPRKIDSDGDGVSDGQEILAGTDPWDPNSFPGPAQPPVDPGHPVLPGNPTPPPPEGEEEEPETVEPTPPLDTTPPNTSITSSPPATTTSTSASFSFSSTEAGTFQCKLDAGAFGSCTSPKPYSGLSVGSHTFSVRATDAAGNTDPTPATKAWTVESSPTPPDTTPPNTTLMSKPGDPTAATSASFTFKSSETSSSFECELDGAPFAACGSSQSYSGLAVGDHSFEVRATDGAGNVDPTPASWGWTVEAAAPPPPPPPPGCVAGATQATTAAQVRSAVQGNHSVCVTADVGDVNLEGLGSKPVIISANGGSMGFININNTTNLTIRSARFRSTELWDANGTTIEGCVIGGTPANRTSDNLINVNVSDDVTIKNNEMGWTITSGTTTGYGIRSPGNELGYNDRLHIEGNYINHIAADAIQGLGNRAADVVIDRNRIDYVAKNPGSDEHSDGMQIINHGVNTQITNNWISHEGFYTEGQPNGSSGTLYIHGDENGNQGGLLIENNLFSDSEGRVEITGLGTGGTTMSNITIRRNTFSNLGLGYTGFPGLRWAATSGSNNVIERNVAVDPDGGFAQNGSASIATFSSNLWGQPSLVTLDSQGNCASANCNPAGQEAIGYRKPSGVSW